MCKARLPLLGLPSGQVGGQGLFTFAGDIWNEGPWREVEGEEGMKGGGEEINYQYGPGSARQVIAVDSPVCHTVNLSLSPGPLPL